MSTSRMTTRVTKCVLLATLLSSAFLLMYSLHPQDLSPREIVVQFREFLKTVPYPFASFVLFTGFGGLALIPINLFLIAAALIFPGWKGFFCGLLGALLASMLQYLVGRYLIDAEFLEEKFGEKFNLIRKRVSKNGFVAMTFLSLVPIAPHIVNNLIAGVCRVRVLHLLIGTTIGFIPGLLVINILGRSVRKFLAQPNLLTAGLVVAVLVAIVLLGKLLHRYINHRFRHRFDRRRIGHEESSVH